MGIVMIRCSETGRAVSTGISARREAFRTTPVFFSHMYCALCQSTHQWFAKDAWVCEIRCRRLRPALRMSGRLAAASRILHE